LKHPHYILRKPIYITVELEKNTVIASLDDIEAFQYADTEFEAINYMCEEIINIYEDLKDDKENLGILPQKWLQYLDEVIENK
jgi:PHD/YefM family antitoxin component YafN of YafNO toxin-antitoxin module